MAGALTGVRVLDISSRMAGAWCSRLLADFGAEVVYLQPHALQQHGPFTAQGLSIPALYALTNKQPVQWTIEHALGQLNEFNVLIDDFHADTQLRARASLTELASRHPSLVHCVITANGSTGQHATMPGNDLTAYAWSGWASMNGSKGRPPLKGPGFQASYQTGVIAAGTVVCALLAQNVSGRGQLIDVGESEVLAWTFAPAHLRSAYTGVNPEQRQTVDFTTGPVPCKDGYFALTPSREHFWIEAMRLLGLPELADNVEMQKSWSRPKHRDTFVPLVHAALTRFDRMTLFKELGKRRVIAGPVLAMDELSSNEHLHSRGYFHRHESTVFPGAPFRMSTSPWTLSNTPADAAHQVARPVSSSFVQRRKDCSSSGPLSGFRGVVLTQAWAGTLTTELMALMGADVIQVEPFTRMDSWRGQFGAPMLPAFKDIPTAEHAWNCNPLFNSVNLNKRSVTLDLSKPEAVSIFKALVAEADFVAENFAPRVMGNLGLDYAALKEVKHDIILLSESGYGHGGPWSSIPAIGGTIEPSSGLSQLLGYPGESPQNSGQMYPDAVAGITGFLALALALQHRDRTGEGQFIDLSMQEACLSFAGDFFLQYQLNGNVPGPQGNVHPDFAPHGVYPAKPDAGGPRWIALAADSDDAFAALASVLDQPHWLTSWRTQAERKAGEAALDAALARVTEQHDATALVARLQQHALMAAPVRRALEVLADPGLRKRGIVGQVTHPETGEHWQATLPCRMTGTPPAVTRHAPLHGEHTLEVLMSLLGLPEPEVRGLAAKRITTIGTLSAADVTAQEKNA